MKAIKMLSLLLFVLVFQSCSTMSTFTSIPPDAKVKIGKTNVLCATPCSGKIGGTTFGRYPVKVTKEGYETLYSNLPLKVKGERIVLDALLFAPAAFFNVQSSVPFYEFDLEQGIIRYKINKNSEWLIYPIPDDQKAAVRQYFDD